jgi:hypothetical protein
MEKKFSTLRKNFFLLPFLSTIRPFCRGLFPVSEKKNHFRLSYPASSILFPSFRQVPGRKEKTFGQECERKALRLLRLLPWKDLHPLKTKGVIQRKNNCAKLNFVTCKNNSFKVPAFVLSCQWQKNGTASTPFRFFEKPDEVCHSRTYKTWIIPDFYAVKQRCNWNESKQAQMVTRTGINKDRLLSYFATDSTPCIPRQRGTKLLLIPKPIR